MALRKHPVRNNPERKNTETRKNPKHIHKSQRNNPETFNVKIPKGALRIYPVCNNPVRNNPEHKNPVEACPSPAKLGEGEKGLPES